MKNIISRRKYKTFKDFKVGDLLKYDNYDVNIFKVLEIKPDEIFCLRIGRIDDDGNVNGLIFDQGDNGDKGKETFFRPDVGFSVITPEEFEKWKIERDAKKYNI